MESDKGYIKLYRKVMCNPVIMKDSDHLAVWVYLLLKAEWKEREILFRGERITLKPGQGVFRYKEIAEELGINISKVRRITELFKCEQKMNIETSNQKSVFSILRWGDYQANEQRMNNERTTNEQRMNNLPIYIRNEEGEEYKNTTRARACESEAVPLRSIIPPTLDMVRGYCQSRGNTIDPEEFLDWYEARDWMTGKTRMKDWQATIRGWERRRRNEKHEETQTGGRLDWIDEL